MNKRIEENQFNIDEIRVENFAAEYNTVKRMAIEELKTRFNKSGIIVTEELVFVN